MVYSFVETRERERLVGWMKGVFLLYFGFSNCARKGGRKEGLNGNLFNGKIYLKFIVMRNLHVIYRPI